MYLVTKAEKECVGSVSPALRKETNSVKNERIDTVRRMRGRIRVRKDWSRGGGSPSVRSRIHDYGKVGKRLRAFSNQVTERRRSTVQTFITPVMALTRT